ncbi:carbon-nitrogen hydrolase family protein [Candidatus Woesearchaeota archaeon]|nr:MAG: carbon-nitrogen hydrolase family protein [Candidatus Woesearchaeota archaeon]
MTRIAVIQCSIRQFDPDYNLKKAELWIKRAKRKKADIVVFPEDFLIGPLGGKLDYADDGRRYKQHFQNLARTHAVAIVTGSFIEKGAVGLHNTTYFIDKTGKTKSRYRKIHLWNGERKYLVPGNELSVFNTVYGKIGLVICWDLAFPELFRAMTKRGVQIVFCPSFWSYGDAGVGVKYEKNAEVNFVNALCSARAFENELVLVYCNAVGTWNIGKHEGMLIGNSQMTVPFKGVLAKLSNKEGMLVADIDLKILNAAEKSYRIRNDLKLTS